MKTITIEIPEGKRAEWVDGVLILVDEQPKDITERIKTFEDAVEWCKKNGKGEFVVAFDSVMENAFEWMDVPRDILAYLKLRIITCALNEGWMPTFEKDRRRFTPYFETNKCTYLYSSGKHVSGTSAKLLYFKSQKLAEYAAAQFKDIYMDFCYKGKE